MNNQRFWHWQGPGWYAPRSEYQPNFGEWETVYHHVGDDQNEIPDSSGLGNPDWFDSEEEL